MQEGRTQGNCLSYAPCPIQANAARQVPMNSKCTHQGLVKTESLITSP